MMHEYSHPLLTRPLVAYGSYRLREPEAMLDVFQLARGGFGGGVTVTTGARASWR